MSSNGFTDVALPEQTRAKSRQGFDTRNLSTNKLPDIEPVVSPSQYLRWRYTNRRGTSNTALDHANENLRRKA
jgi:hypothetical protein